MVLACFMMMANAQHRQPRKIGRKGTETVNIVATNLTVDDWNLWGWEEIDVYASTNTYEVGIYIEATAPTGSFTEDDLYEGYSYILGTDTAWVETASFTIAEDGSHYKLSGSVKCNDGQTYVLDLSYAVPEKTRTASVTITDAEWGDYRYYDGSIQGLGYSADGKKYFSLCVYTDDIAGTYEAGDFDDYYTYLCEIEGTDTVYFDFVDGSCEITVDGDEISATGKVLLKSAADADDVPEYTFSITGKMTSEEEEEEEEGDNLLTNGGFETWTSDAQPTGWEGWQITEKGNTGGATLSKSTDAHSGTYSCQVAGASSNKRLSTGKMTLAAGTYHVSLYAKAAGTSGAIKPGYATLQSSGSASYNYGDFANNPVSLTQSWQKVSYDITLSEKTDLAIIIMNYKNSGDCLIDDVYLSTSGGGGGEEGEPLEYDETTDFIYDFTSGITVDDDFLEDYGVLYVDAEMDGKYIGLEFNVEEKDSKITIPEGTYTIDSTYGVGTVSASDGLDDEGYVTYSFAANLDDEGYLSDVWFLVSGTVTVKNVDGKLSVTVDAKNSNGNSVKCTIGAGGDTPTPQGNDIYSIDFTQGQGDWTIKDVDKDEDLSYVWKQSSSYGMKASAYVSKTYYVVDSWIVSPAITIGDTYESATLTFNHGVNYCAAPAEHLSALISDDGTNFAELDVEDWPVGDSWDFMESSVSLNEYLGKTVYLAFRYTSTDSEAAIWEIKSVKVEGEISSGISHVENAGNVENKGNCFDLTGRKLPLGQLAPLAPSGLYIINGKKVFVK